MTDHLKPVRLAPRDVIGLGLLGIRTRKMRAVLSALGISIGIATLIVVTGIPASSQQALLAELSALGTNMLQASTAPNEQNVKLPEESAGMVGRIGPVLKSSAVANTHTVIRRSDRIDRLDGSGLTVLASRPDLLPVLNAKTRLGRFLEPATAKFPMVVLGSVAASRLGFTNLPADGSSAQVLIAESWFTVVGVLDTTPLSPDIDRAALVSWESARAELGFDGHPTIIYVQCRESAIEAVRHVLPATIFPQQPNQVLVTRPSDALAAKRATENTFSALFLGLAAVALLVGGIGVANTMVISVLERRSEIGLRRALGANRGQIRGQFLTESVVLSLLGGIAGTGFGLAATAAYATHNGWPIVVPLTSFGVGIGGSVLVGVIAGVYPSVRAARLTPTEALASA